MFHDDSSVSGKSELLQMGPTDKRVILTLIQDSQDQNFTQKHHCCFFHNHFEFWTSRAATANENKVVLADSRSSLSNSDSGPIFEAQKLNEKAAGRRMGQKIRASLCKKRPGGHETFDRKSSLRCAEFPPDDVHHYTPVHSQVSAWNRAPLPSLFAVRLCWREVVVVPDPESWTFFSLAWPTR